VVATAHKEVVAINDSASAPVEASLFFFIALEPRVE
jgi:hypothetical protein